jgi:hypothetical protein
MLLLARIVGLAGSAAIALLLAGISIHFLELGSQPDAVATVERAAKAVASPFDGVFLPPSENLRILLNWGLAAVVYALLASQVTYLLARAGEGIALRRRA